MPDFKKQNKGGAGYGELSDDDLAFLGGAKGPWKSDFSGASESGTYQSRRWNDNDGHVRGANWDDTNDHGLRNLLPDEARNPVVADKSLWVLEHGGPSGPLLAGPSPLPQDHGVQSGPPRHAPKGSPSGAHGSGPVGNMKRPK
jgi:hypothetical protein